jgi:hypothetical protein
MKREDWLTHTYPFAKEQPVNRFGIWKEREPESWWLSFRVGSLGICEGLHLLLIPVLEGLSHVTIVIEKAVIRERIWKKGKCFKHLDFVYVYSIYVHYYKICFPVSFFLLLNTMPLYFPLRVSDLVWHKSGVLEIMAWDGVVHTNSHIQQPCHRDSILG